MATLDLSCCPVGVVSGDASGFLPEAGQPFGQVHRDSDRDLTCSTRALADISCP